MTVPSDPAGAIVRRRNPRAKRLQLRIDGAARQAVLVIPDRISDRRAEQFLAEHMAWVTERLDALPAPIAFLPDAVIPVEGTPTRLLHRPALGSAAIFENGALALGGRSAGFARKVRAWLHHRARGRFRDEAHHFAERLGRVPAAVSLRDGKTRWGSCSSAGRIALSWRLILAPPAVRRYVIAHEVAHLVEMNHGRAFWDLVATLCGEVSEQRAWLRKNGESLRRYG